MKTSVGLWIDYREAVIVTCMNQRDQIRRIPSYIEKVVADLDDANVSQQDKQDKRLDAHYTRYYGKVIGAIRHADSILIFGPDNAKHELQKKLDRQGLAEQIITVEAMGSMKAGQIAAKVQEHIRKRETEHEHPNTD